MLLEDGVDFSGCLLSPRLGLLGYQAAGGLEVALWFSRLQVGTFARVRQDWLRWDGLAGRKTDGYEHSR